MVSDKEDRPGVGGDAAEAAHESLVGRKRRSGSFIAILLTASSLLPAKGEKHGARQPPAEARRALRPVVELLRRRQIDRVGGASPARPRPRPSGDAPRGHGRRVRKPPLARVKALFDHDRPQVDASLLEQRVPGTRQQDFLGSRHRLLEPVCFFRRGEQGVVAPGDDERALLDVVEKRPAGFLLLRRKIAVVASCSLDPSFRSAEQSGLCLLDEPEPPLKRGGGQGSSQSPQLRQQLRGPAGELPRRLCRARGPGRGDGAAHDRQRVSQSRGQGQRQGPVDRGGSPRDQGCDRRPGGPRVGGRRVDDEQPVDEAARPGGDEQRQGGAERLARQVDGPRLGGCFLCPRPRWRQPRSRLARLATSCRLRGLPSPSGRRAAPAWATAGPRRARRRRFQARRKVRGAPRRFLIGPRRLRGAGSGCRSEGGPRRR